MTLPTVVFDVNETLSDMSPMGQRFEEVGLPAEAAQLWFARLLRDGFALAAAGDARSFREVAAATLRSLLAAHHLPESDHAVEQVLEGMQQLGVHPDVVEGVRALREAGATLVTLTNGAVGTSTALFERAGILDAFARLLSVDGAGVWKPAPAAYRYAVDAVGREPSELMLVAVHPWDIHGAARAGLRTAWLNRSGASFPPIFSEPEITITRLPELAERLASR